MNSQRIVYISTLISKSLSGNITAEEQKILDEWLKESPRHQKLFEKYQHPDFLSSVDFEKDLMESQKAYQLFMNRVNSRSPFQYILQNKYAAAAVLFAFVCLSSLFIYVSSDKNLSQLSRDAYSAVEQPASKTDSADIVLITASGKTIPMHNTEKMLTVSSESIKIGDQSITTNNKASTANTAVAYNTLKILRGKRFKMKLSDGTIVWLNSESEITFPDHFNEKNRLVSIKGELFFDVAEDKAHPFIVETPNGKIQVLGTAFNVHCYQDEIPTTTLVRGKISYTLGEQSIILAPGQQCRVERDKLTIKNVDTYEYTSWIDDIIVFKDKSLREIMNTLSRLYNVNIQYTDQQLQQIHFTGAFKQYEHLDDIIKMIEECGLIHIDKDDDNLIIRK